ncbi:MAG TPA: 3-oxoacyl-ACP reductase family protein [Clostridia bacterium]|nr:3-oxoacyl-ACP reductase family protein [Clostridia bacterium]
MNTKTMLITGSSRGIGAEIARQAIGEFNIILCYNQSEEKAALLCAQLSKYGGVIALQADVSKSNEVAELVKRAEAHFGKIDILVNCAGIAQQKLFTDITDEDWRTMMSVNLDGAFYCSRAVLSGMISRKCGKIINITSMWGEVGASCEVHYSASKAGLIGMTKALAQEVAPSGITVNAVSAGAIQTDMLNDLGEETIEVIKNETPLGRIGTPADVANAVLFLARESGNFITGQVLSVNGGFVI